MYHVYVLQSLTNHKFYIGQTSNIEKRLANHNSGLCKSTKSGLPWKIIYLEAFQSRGDAMLREKVIKSYKGGEAFKALIK